VRFDFYFTKGWYTKSVDGKKVIIQFADNQQANLKFAYSGSMIQDGSRIIFSPAIHVWVKSSSGGISFSVDTIWYDNNGKFKNWGGVRYDHPGTYDLNQIGAAQTGLALDYKSESLFNGKVFKNFSDAKKSDVNGNPIVGANQPCLTNVIIKKPNETEPGLAVSFIPNSTIHFSSKISTGTFDNVVSLSHGNFEFRYLEYDLVNKTVDCEISQFDIAIQNGVLQTNDMLLNLSSGSNIKFNRLKIFHSANSSEVNGENGTVDVQVAGGTKVLLYKTSRYKQSILIGSIKSRKYLI